MAGRLKIYNESNDQWEYVTYGIPGDTGVGEKGDTGVAGVKGDTGSQGIKGDTGDKGDTGIQGEQGDTGDVGAKGDTGTAGAKGDTGDQGDTGVEGTQYTWLGAWDSGTTYAVNDCVEHEGSGYVAIQAGTNKEPGVETAYWDLLVSKGEQGDTGQGEKGDTGTTGAKGDTGTQGDTGAGEKGDTGDRGDTGISGEKGDTGVKGDTGTAGAKGDTGVKGDTGAGITSIVQDTSPQLGGDLDMNDKNIKLKFEPSSDDTASGLIISVTVDTNTNGIGSPLFMAADGHFDDADADATTTAPCVVLALESGTGTKKVLVHGIMRNDDWNWTTGPGEAGLIYLSTTAGTLTQTKPSGTDDVVQPVGWALSDDCMYFSPSLLYFTHT